MSGILPIETLKQADLVLLVVRSDRAWTNADTRAIALLQRVTTCTIAVVLNGITLERSEDLIGEIPKDRTSVRRMIKRLASFEFTPSGLRKAA